jgi:hypothetical protein
MKFSWVISQVRWFSLVETNVSKTISVLVLRVVEVIWVRWTTQSFYLYLSKLRPLATGGFPVRSLLSLPGPAFWLDRTSGYMDRIVKEAIHIRLNKESFNRNNGFNLSRAWFPITRMLASQKAEPGKDSSDLTGKPPVASGRP